MSVANRWIIDDEVKLGIGGVGCVVLGADNETGEDVAVKLVSCIEEYSELLHEKLIYDHLHAFKDATGIPKVHFHGQLSDEVEFLVMQRLGFSLQDYKEAYGGKVPVILVLLVALQALDRLEFIHDKGILHLDVKPGNMLVGKMDPEILYLVDYGFARRFHDSGMNEHTSYCVEGERNFYGTLDFASHNMHAGFEMGRKDDLESLGYTLIYMIKGELPWTREAGSKSEPAAEIDSNPQTSKGRNAFFWLRESLTALSKLGTDDEDLCDNIPCGSLFLEYFKRVRQLEFEERPDYKLYREIFKRGLRYMFHEDSDLTAFLNEVQENLENRVNSLSNVHIKL